MFQIKAYSEISLALLRGGPAEDFHVGRQPPDFMKQWIGKITFTYVKLARFY
ncbi:hypothetical protein [Methylocapsa palsarum]|uniref:hypothetical protein n=1 Tax=Methylocapsa palsarum TaxID=1612308 RepID=UPI0015870EF2|nr:hypothetical protein [Methylocapsa palsarum]